MFVLGDWVFNLIFFYVHISVHHKSMNLEDQRDAFLSSLYLFHCQVILQVSGVSRTHHQEYINCSYNHWYRSWIWRFYDKIWLKRVHGRAATSLRSWFFLIRFYHYYHYIFKFMTCISGCNYSLCTPDDGCRRHPKPVEWLGSEINKDCLEMHLVGLLNTKTYDARKYEHKIPQSLFRPAQRLFYFPLLSFIMSFIIDTNLMSLHSFYFSQAAKPLVNFIKTSVYSLSSCACSRAQAHAFTLGNETNYL